MAQKEEKILPEYLNLDTAYERLNPDESPFIKGVSMDIGGNPSLGIGTNNPSGEGQNSMVLTPTRSNKAIPNVLLPKGYNKSLVGFESVTTQEIYQCNFNSLGNHGIYVYNGNTDTWQVVHINPLLNFSQDPKAHISSHRASLRVVYNNDGSVKEKYLILTDGFGWQKMISVIASIKTNSFNAIQFPYWKLQPPHFDGRALIEYAARPPMVKPIVSLIANTPNDLGKKNDLADKAFQYSYNYDYTDRRPTAHSPYSLPLVVATTDYITNAQNLPKNAQLILDAGGPMVEKINIYVRQALVEKSEGAVDENIEWGDWYLYDTVFKYTTSGANDPQIIGDNYWLRTNPWVNNTYDAIQNTIEYIFDNSKQNQLVDQKIANRLSNEIPNRSRALSDLGDAILLANNELGYDNFSQTELEKLSVSVVEKKSSTCQLPLRKIRLYAYVGRCGDNFSYISQVGFVNGADKTVRFGGLLPGVHGTKATVDVDETKGFGLDFADKTGFRCYLKGTKYYADGQWYQVNSDNSLVKLEVAMDFSNEDILTGVQKVIDAGGYYVCVFDIIAPAGRYIATLGRHNVSSSGDYRNQSTYIMGIANSRIKSTSSFFIGIVQVNNVISIKPNAVAADFSKEMEVDCTASDIDVWGNGRDLFYVYCPYTTKQGNRNHRFIEGYLYESASNLVPVERFGYIMDHSAMDDGGRYTDKNGFYWAYSKAANSDQVNIEFHVNINCAGNNNIVFKVPTSQSGIGWKQNAPGYLADHNNSVVGDCNRVIVKGTAVDKSGLPLSNIAISIVNGSTALTKSDGTFQLIVHNGGTPSQVRVDNMYINAGGNFLITIDNCGYLPLYLFDESKVQCSNCNVRIYPLNINLILNVVASSDTSLKEAGKYPVCVYGGDLAGRLMNANPLGEKYVTSFLERNNTNATFLRLKIDPTLDFSAYPDMKWITIGVGKNRSIRRYMQWVGDSIQYVDNNGNIVSNPASAVFCSISIQSLIDFNIGNNFSTLAAYEFTKGDRLRVLDDGLGTLLNVAGFGDPIDVQILGTNYNQAAIEAQLLPTPENTVLNTSGATQPTGITLFVRYDSRLDQLIKKTGFWIELYTPTQLSDVFPYYEAAGFYPIIDGKIAQFTGYDGSGKPTYDFPDTIDIQFWDTYLIQRNISIPGTGDKYFNHPFESPNVNDSFGANLMSGGRQWVKNDNARRQWYPADTIKSDVLVNNNSLNGIGTFRTENRKDFSAYPWGGIVSVHSERSIVFFLCENDWFVTNFNFNYAYPNEQGIMVVSLTDALSSPQQKTEGKYGCSYEHVGTVVYGNGVVSWFDMNNAGFIICNYRQAIDVSDIEEQRGNEVVKIGIKSYLTAKCNYIALYNNEKDIAQLFDVISGMDPIRNNVYLTFKKRSNNSSNPLAYVNRRRNLDLTASETFVYNLNSKRWTRCAEFTPECYGVVRGAMSGVEMVTFMAGAPYRHNYTGNTSYNNFYGVQTEPVIIATFNKERSAIKMLQNIVLDINGVGMYIDMIYSDEQNSFSYIPLSLFRTKKNQLYASVLRNMVCYPSIDRADLFRSMLVDGKRVKGAFFNLRMVADPSTNGQYFEFKNLYIAYVPVEGESITTGADATKS